MDRGSITTPFADCPKFVVALRGKPMPAHLAVNAFQDYELKMRDGHGDSHWSGQSQVKFERGMHIAALRAEGGARPGYCVCGGKDYKDADGRMRKACVQLAVPMAMLGAVQTNGAGGGVMEIFAKAGHDAVRAVKAEGFQWCFLPDVFGVPLNLDAEPMNPYISRSCYPFSSLNMRGEALLGLLEKMMAVFYMPFNGDGTKLELQQGLNLSKPGIIRETHSPYELHARPAHVLLDFQDSQYWKAEIEAFRTMARIGSNDETRRDRKEAELAEREASWIMCDDPDQLWRAVTMANEVGANHFGDSPIAVWEKVNAKCFRREAERISKSILGA